MSDDKTPPTNLVTAPRPNPNAAAQKGLAFARIHIEFPHDTPEFVQRQTKDFVNLLVGWCRLRSHVQRAGNVTHIDPNRPRNRRGRRRR